MPRQRACRILVLAVTAAVVVGGCSARRPTPAPPPARNVILLIGDGMADAAITIARNYHVGANGRLRLDSLPWTGDATTHSLLESDPTRPDYVTDSAASATALATGRKTSNYRVSTAAGTNVSLPTILERAMAAGHKVGLVSTASLADATPAAFAAHVNDRWCHGPEQMAACPSFHRAMGGPGSIVEQMIALGPDVLLGGGAVAFEQAIASGPGAGRRVRDWAAERGYSVVDSAAQMNRIEPGSKVLGIFAPMELAVGSGGVVASLPPAGAAEACRPLSRPAHEPRLAEMTAAALRLLQPATETGPGFFLMVEGALIDKRAHAADLCGQIGETVEFDVAVGVALDFAAENPDTFVIVTGDHDHAPQIIANQTAGQSLGLTASVRTADGVTMTVQYASGGLGMKQLHAGTQLRVAAQGPGAEGVRGLLDQTDIHDLMVRVLGLPPLAPSPGGESPRGIP